MKICIIGCGAVGSLFAAHLARAGEAEVWAYDVWNEHIDAIRKHGLRLSGAAEFTAQMNATSNPQELPRCDYGIVATKAIHTASAIAQTAHIFDQNGAVCSVQNGVGNEEIITEGEAVAGKLKITLHGDPRELVKKGANAPGKHRASMLQDVLARRQTEVDFMNGAIVQWGEKTGVPTPLNKALWELIKGLEHSWRDPD